MNDPIQLPLRIWLLIKNRMLCATRSSGRGTNSRKTAPGKQKRISRKPAPTPRAPTSQPSATLTSCSPRSGAREILEAYWEKIGGKPEPKVKEPKSTGKKRGRQSTGSAVEPTKKQQKKGRKSTSALQDNTNDDNDDFPVGYADAPDSWEPPNPNDNAWDPLLMQVDTIEKDNNGDLWAYLAWNEKNEDGRFKRSKARLTTCRKACPQKMLDFYEKHVYVFFTIWHI